MSDKKNDNIKTVADVASVAAGSTSSDTVAPELADGAPARAADPEAAALRELSEEIAAEFPLTVDATTLVLMEVDPRQVHAYWSLTPEDLERARMAFGDGADAARLVLRLRDVSATGVAPETFDREVQGLQGHCLVDIWSDGRAYDSELGLQTDQGGWVSLVRSNRVQMSVAMPVAEHPHPPGRPEATPDRPADEPVALPETQPPAPEPQGPAVSVAVPDGTGEATEPALAAEPDPELAPEFPNIGQVEPTRAASLQPPPEGVPPTLLPAAPGAVPAPATPAPAPPLPPEASSASPPQSSLDPLLMLSSSALGRSDVALEISAELHLHGRVRPGSDLQLFGRRVPVRPDGTFSIVRPLPNGALIVPLLLAHDGLSPPDEES